MAGWGVEMMRAMAMVFALAVLPMAPAAAVVAIDAAGASAGFRRGWRAGGLATGKGQSGGEEDEEFH